MPDLRADLARYMAQYGGPVGVKSATLVKVTAGTRTAGSVSGGTNPTSTNYACTALISVLTVGQLGGGANATQASYGTEIKADDRRIVIFGGSLDASVIPAPNDKVTIVDVDGVERTFRLVAPVSGDGVGAAFGFQARRT